MTGKKMLYTRTSANRYFFDTSRPYYTIFSVGVGQLRGEGAFGDGGLDLEYTRFSVGVGQSRCQGVFFCGRGLDLRVLTV